MQVCSLFAISMVSGAQYYGTTTTTQAQFGAQQPSIQYAASAAQPYVTATNEQAQTWPSVLSAPLSSTYPQPLLPAQSAPITQQAQTWPSVISGPSVSSGPLYQPIYSPSAPIYTPPKFYPSAQTVFTPIPGPVYPLPPTPAPFELTPYVAPNPTYTTVTTLEHVFVPDVMNTCSNRCGLKAHEENCYCDDACVASGDCCTAYYSTCANR